jgi:acyl carrier protein
MNTDEVYSQLTSIFHEVFDDSDIVLTPEMTAGDLKDWDSFNHINLIVTIESRLKIKFKTAEIESLRNVGQLAEVIKDKVNGV